MRCIRSGAVALAAALLCTVGVAAPLVAVGSSPAGATATADVTPPTITLTTPAHGAVYRVGQAVSASYTCGDDSGSVASCTGTKANGAPLDTASVGPHTFVVYATDGAGNPTAVAHSYRVLAGTPTTIGPTDVGALSGGPVNVNGAVATVKVSAPVPNGGQLGIGDRVHVDWSLYRSKPTIILGISYYGNNGPDPLTWTFTAPANAAIDGPVTADQNGLHGETSSSAHAGGGGTGVKSVTPASPSKASQLAVSFDENSSPGISDAGDGIVAHVGFDLVVTGTGTVAVPGSGAVTGHDCGILGISCGDFSVAGVAGSGVSYQAVDTAPPSISITSPTNGQVVAPNAPLTMGFSCSDNSGAASLCEGSATNGQALDTSTSGPHQVHVTASDPSGNLTESWATYVVADPTVAVSDCASALGFTCDFVVSLSNPSEHTVTVPFATADGTLTAPSGYTAASGTLTFAPGETTKHVTVSIPQGGHAGAFSLNLGEPTAATLADGTGAATVTGPPPTMGIADASLVRPGSGTASLDFAVTLDAPPLTPVGVHYQTNDGTAVGLLDFTPQSGTLIIPAGQQTAHVMVPVLGNQSDEPNKTFTVTLSAPQQALLGRSIATGTIQANHLLAGCGVGASATERYVCHVYLDVLGRAAEPGGKAYWVNLLSTGTSRSRMGTLYFDTPEARTVRVDRLYVFYLGRHGDAAGVAFWAEKLKFGRSTPDDVRVLLLKSPEYFTRAGGTNAAFVQQVYQDVFRRPVDAGGAAYWTGLLNKGETRAKMAADFLHTTEGRTAVVNDVYLQFLRRIPAPGENTYWVNAFTHGTSEVSLDVQIVASPEYFNRA